MTFTVDRNGKHYLVLSVVTFYFVFMHLSLSSPRGGGVGRATHGNLTVACIPRVGILIGHHPFYL